MKKGNFFLGRHYTKNLKWFLESSWLWYNNSSQQQFTRSVDAAVLKTISLGTINPNMVVNN